MLMGTHDVLFVALSILIAVLASYTALDLANRVKVATGRVRSLWLFAAAMVLGGGIWSMHFVAMLAFRMPGMTVSYDPLLTLLSLALSIGVTGIGFWVMDRSAKPWRLGTAGVFMGLGIVAMHYVGMAAMKMDVRLTYDRNWVAVSVLIAIAAAVGALALTRQNQRGLQRIVAALLMGSAISGMHFAGMRAVSFLPGIHAADMSDDGAFSQAVLAGSVTVLTLFILLTGLGAATLDRRFQIAARREARTALRLRLAEAMRDVGTTEALQETAALMGAHFGVARAGYATLDPTEDVFEYTICWTDGSVAPLLGRDPAVAFRLGILSTLHAGQTIIIPDLAKEQTFDLVLPRGAVSKVDTRALLIVPFLHGGRLQNIVYLNAREPRLWTADEVVFLEEIAERSRQVIARAAAEKQLRELNETLELRIQKAVSERRILAEVVDNTSASVMVCDSELNILALNAAQIRNFERAHARIPKAGMNLLDLFSEFPDHQEMFLANWKRALAGETFVVVNEFNDAALGPVNFEAHFHPMRDSAERVTGAFITAYDVTTRVRAQQELEIAQEALRQSQKMEAMGQLTGGVAHDFNNLLTPILGVLDMLQRRSVGDERQKRLIAGAYQSADKARVLVQRLLAFARRQPLQAVPVDTGDLIASMADLVGRTIGPQIKVVVDVPPALPFARADPNQLEMAILNLSVNARDAMPDGGLLRITARAHSLQNDSGDLAAGRYVSLSVIDTGTGMDEQTRLRAIEPFFSTKGIGRGTGLGLSMAHGLASQLGGALRIHSRPGVGTTVELLLPQSDAPIEFREQILSPSSALDTGRVLLVDDEDQVRWMTADMLHELGYTVVEAASAEEAIALVENGMTFDLLLTDHLMPGMTGIDLANRIRAVRPKLRTLLISGYAEAEGIGANIPRLVKPFRKDELAASLAEL